MKKYILLITIFFTFKCYSQNHPIELPDSVFLKIYLQDSLDDLMQNDKFYNVAATTGNPCLISNSESYTNNVNLLDLNMPYALIFEDNFDYLNSGFWNVIDNCNSECWNNPDNYKADNCSDQLLKLPYWDKENVKIIEKWDGNHMLAITADHDPASRKDNTWNTGWTASYEYTSGFIHSKKAFPYDAGVFQARIRLPQNIDFNGMQPAFWLMSQGNDPWNEFDIFEFQDHDNKMTSSIHVNPNELGHSKDECVKSYTHFGIFDGYVTYTCYWNKFAIVVFIDWDYKILGIPYHKSKCIYTHSHFLKHNTRAKYKETDIPAGRTVDRKLYYPTKPMRIMLNLYTYFCHQFRTGTSKYPATMEIDWVKVWYKQPCHKDLVINSSTQLPQNPDLYNYISGKNVTINCDYTLPANVSLKIAHSGDLTSTKQIEVGIDGYLDVSPEPSLCEFDPVGQVIPLNQSKLIDNKRTMAISIYPNPVSRELYIASSDDDLLSGSNLYIYSLTGLLMLKHKLINQAKEINKIPIELSKGCYIVKIVKNDVIIETDKICIIN